MDVFTAFSGRNDLCRLVNYSTIIVKYVPFRSEPEYYVLNEKTNFIMVLPVNCCPRRLFPIPEILQLNNLIIIKLILVS